MNKMHVGMMSVILGTALALTGCFEAEEVIDEQIVGMQAESPLPPMASFDSKGLHFASEEVARAWAEEAPGVWRHQSTEQRLIVGERGHQSAIALLQAELDELNADGADDEAIVGQESILRGLRLAADKARGEQQTEASCNIATYNGGSSPFIGFIGGAALAEISCINGTVVFTVMSQVCTGTTGCSPTNVQTAIPSSVPQLWGTVRSGYGTCSSFVSLSPSGIFDSNVYFCN